MNLLRRLAATLKRQVMLVKATSFALVGVVNTAIDLAVFLAAYNLFQVPLIPANVMAWFVAVSFSYVMNSTITFAAESGRKLRWRDYGTFAASGVVGVVANTTTLVLASYVVPVLLAKFLAIGVSFLVNFTLSHFVVFRKRAGISVIPEPAEGRNPESGNKH